MAHCTCPANPRTAADFDAVIACPETDPLDVPMLQRSALRLRQREAKRDPRSITFDSRLVADDEIRRHHARAFLVCECPICAPVEAARGMS